MTRALRPDPINGWHHVMSRGVDRADIFFSNEDRLDFGRLLGEISTRFGVETHAYCLMGNHFHLLVRCPDGRLSDAMHYLLSIFARLVNNRTGRTGHLFGDRFCSRLIVDVQYIANVVRYIHLNPLDIVGIDLAADYRWSSHRTYLGLRPPPEWLRLDPVLGWFDDVAAFGRFVSGSYPAESVPITIDDPGALIGAIDMVLAERSDAPFRHIPAQQRAVALTLADGIAGPVRAQLLTELGITTDGALRTARSRARAVVRNEPVVADAIRATRGLLARDALFPANLAA